MFQVLCAAVIGLFFVVAGRGSGFCRGEDGSDRPLYPMTRLMTGSRSPGIWRGRG